MFAAGLIFLGYKSLRGGLDYYKFFEKELNKTPSDFTPYCSVIVPCRGLDQNLRANLAPLLRQNHPGYEVIFVVDDETDDAVPVIKDLIGQSTNRSCSAKLVIAAKSTDSSQKVENLRAAVQHTSGESEVFVFVDSDARPGADWLRDLIAPLSDAKIGAATGYRWFISEKNNFASHLRSVWNASIASALGANVKSNFCWGGSMALRRDVFESIDMREKWRGTLSDDFAITRALKDANLPIIFVPQALTASVEDCTFGELLEFSTRQMKITRVYAPHLWLASLIGSLLFTVVFWSGFTLLFFTSGWRFGLTLGALLLIFGLGVAKAWIRLKAVELVLKNYNEEINQSFFWQLALWTITPIIYLYNCLQAFFSNEIRWRGIRYKLKSPYRTILIK